KHLKRKKFLNVAQIAQDVELVFSNAMKFNEDRTPLWEAAPQLEVRISLLTNDQLIKLSGIFCEIDIFISVLLRASTTICFQRSSTPGRKLKVPSAHQSPNFNDQWHYRDFPTTARDEVLL
ncbi:hypothetical protein BGY98DRAFT_929151, partial [Russula aff. rugulosa BPL654]